MPDCANAVATKPLREIGILVTRPVGQEGGLCRLIEAGGGEALRLPLLEIVPERPTGVGARWLGRLSEVDWLIFVSANAVRHALKLFDPAQEPSGRPKIAAIGLATSEELARHGVMVDLVPKQQFNSEALLALPEFADVAGRRILVVRGANGRETLAETLRMRGAEVAYAEVYRRVLPKTDVDALIARWRAGTIRIVIITSGEALSNLARLLAGEGTDLLRQTPLVVISERLRKLACDLGCTRVTVAAAASDQAIFESVISLAASS